MKYFFWYVFFILISCTENQDNFIKNLKTSHLVIHDTLNIKCDDLGNPCYCSEKLVSHEEEGKYNGTAFDIGTAGIYEDIYFAITEGRALTITSEMVAQLIGVIEEVHARNPLPLKFFD